MPVQPAIDTMQEKTSARAMAVPRSFLACAQRWANFSPMLQLQMIAYLME
jgi:hypothetical protein